MCMKNKKNKNKNKKKSNTSLNSKKSMKDGKVKNAPNSNKSKGNKDTNRNLNINRGINNRKPDNSSFNEKKSIKINTTDVYGNNIYGRNNNSNNNIRNQNTSRNLNSNQYINQYNKYKSKEVSSGEAIDKMLSIGKSFFVNGTIFIAISTVAIGGFVFFSGYDPIPIIEKNFIYTSKKDTTEENVITKLASLNISKDLITEDVFNKYYDFVNIDLREVLLDNNLFNDGSKSFNAKMIDFYSEEYIKNLSSNDVIYNALSDIYDGENRYPYSLSLTSIGKVIRNSKALTKLSVDINAVDDDLGFHVWNLALFMDDNGKITDVKVLAENKTLKNTRTPLSPSLSLITNGIKDSTTRSVNTFLKGITNENLYNKLVANGKSLNTSQLKAFFSKLNLSNIDYDTLTEMFEVSKGNGSNFAITEVISTDFDGEPITNIILSLKLDDNTYKYDLQYNRRDKALIGVSKL